MDAYINNISQKFNEATTQAPWLKWAGPVILVILLLYGLTSLMSQLDNNQSQIERLVGQKFRLQSVDMNQDLVVITEQVETNLKKYKSSSFVYETASLGKAKLIQEVEKIANDVGIEKVDVSVSEPYEEELQTYFDANISFSRVYGYQFEQFWHGILTANDYMRINALTVNQNKERVVARFNIRILATLQE